MLVIFVWCLVHSSDSRGRIWTKIGHVKATSLPELPKPERVQQKQQGNQHVRPTVSTTTHKTNNPYV